MADNKLNKVFLLTEQHREKLEAYCNDRGWEFGSAPYAYWKVKGDGLSLVAYESGKLTVQGKKSGEFIEFVLEVEIFETSAVASQTDSGSMMSSVKDQTVGWSMNSTTPHGGIDESGKGDFFGPLVVAGAYVDETTAPMLADLGVKDSKLIKNTMQIYAVAPKIRKILDRKYSVITIGNEAYNRLYSNIKNLNRLLAWGHARVIENLLDQVPECPRMLSDKFANEILIKRALMEKGKKVILEQQVRAESDIAVAAASILAREGFLRMMDKLSMAAGCELPRGASAKVNECAEMLARSRGLDFLGKFVKMHFKTYEALKNKLESEK